MKLNSDISVVGEKVTLVPYLKGHVLKYHEWMCDEEMLIATASDPLSLEEEYEMQESWSKDDDKITFIILDITEKGDEEKMVGDVNCFLNDRDGDKTIAEIEIMIAEKSAKRKGLASEALQLMMLYCRQHLGIIRFYAKIGEDNKASLALFKSPVMNYKQCNYVKAFQEYELELLVPPFEAQQERGVLLKPFNDPFLFQAKEHQKEQEKEKEKEKEKGKVNAKISSSTSPSKGNIDPTTTTDPANGPSSDVLGDLSDLLEEVVSLAEEEEETIDATTFSAYVQSMLPVEILEQLQTLTGGSDGGDDSDEDSDSGGGGGFLHAMWTERYAPPDVDTDTNLSLYSFAARTCECCEREGVNLTRHHVYPKETHKTCLKRGLTNKDLQTTLSVCRLCHSTMHRYIYLCISISLSLYLFVVVISVSVEWCIGKPALIFLSSSITSYNSASISHNIA